jgi:hypothetical protein
MKKMKAKGYSRGGAPMGMKTPGNEIVLPDKKSPKLSSAQENLLRQAQSYAKETGQNPAERKAINRHVRRLERGQRGQDVRSERRKKSSKTSWRKRYWASPHEHGRCGDGTPRNNCSTPPSFWWPEGD